jgi:hypothetical protein
MRAIERRLRRLERHRAAEDFDPVEAHRLAVEAYENGEPIPPSFTGEARSIAEAIYSTLRHFDNQWNYEGKLPLEPHEFRS